MASLNLKRLLQWRLKTLLVFIALLAAVLACWNYLIVPYNLQLAAKRSLGPLTSEMQSVPAKPWWLTKISPERFSRIVQLRSRSSELDDETIAPIADMPFIRRLYLNRTAIGDRGLMHIGQLKELERLSLWGSRVSDDGLSSLTKCKKLVALDLHTSSVSDEGLAQLVELPELRELILGEGVCGPGLKYVADMPRLVRLDLSRSSVQFDSLNLLANSKIGWLQLPYQIPARYCDVLATMPNLRVCNPQLVQADDRTADVLSQCRLLESVDLVGVGITDAATDKLVKMPRLASLSLRGNLTDATLSKLATATQIKVANLNGRFSMPAMKRLAAQRPDLQASIQTTVADSYQQLAKDFYVRSLIRSDGARSGKKRRLTVTWPATARDLLLRPADQLSSVQAVWLQDPPTVKSGFRSQLQREWTLAGLESLPLCHEIRVPRLAGGELARLVQLQHLAELVIVDDQLTDAELETIQLPPNCKRLIIAPSKVSRGAMARLKKRYPQVEMRENGHGGIFGRRRWQAPWVGQGSIDDMLQFPNLEEVQIEDVTSTLDITPLAALTKLQAISFRGGIRHAPIWTLEKNLPQIQSLTCVMRGFNNVQMNGLGRMPSLKRLLLREVTITDSGFAIFGKTPDLEVIDIHAGFVTGSGLRHLVHCKKLKSIRIRSASLQGDHLSHLKSLPDLKQLKLSYNRLGDEACKHLAQIPALEELELERTAITDEGLASLGHCPSLKTLFIGSNQVTEEGLRGVARCESLRKIHIARNPEITDEAKRRIHVAFPHVRIEK